MAELSKEQWRRLLNHRGYGNPDGPYWFVGIEEYGAGTVEELSFRADNFREIDDLARVHSLPEFYFDIRNLIPTWATMSKIILRLKGDPSWSDKETIRDYQSERLGRNGGETFLTELLPLPKPADAHWPEWWPWASWDKYFDDVRTQRINALRELFEVHQPRFVFCYGKSYWPYHKQIFSDTNFTPIVGGKLQTARLGGSQIVLTPFFAWFLMANTLVDSMACALENLK